MDTTSESNPSKNVNIAQPTDVGNGNDLKIVDAQPLDQPLKAGKKVESIDNSQNPEEPPPELEMREEVTSPTQEDFSLQIVDEQSPIKNGGDAGTMEIEDQQTIQTPEEMKKIILTQGQLKTLSDCPNETFRSVVTGCFVRVNMPNLPQNYADRIFLDQIVDILEPQSYQHLWLNRRFRLSNLGDFELEKVVSLKVQQDNELRPWFDYMEAKAEPLPTKGFIKQKERDVNFALQELALREKSEEGANGKPAKVQIRRDDLAKIALNPATLRTLAKLPFERFLEVVKGCFVCMPAIRQNKPKDCQYHIVRVRDCAQGQREYRIKNVALVNYQLVLPFYGNYIINWVKSFAIVSHEGYRLWIEDMKSWKEPIPTLDEIREKAAQLQLALNEAEKMPSPADLEKQRKEEEEFAKRAKLSVQSARELEPALLTRAQLEKLGKIQLVEELSKVLTGCFVRLNAGGAGSSGNNSELDQILSVEITEKKGGRTDKVLDLKYAGTISLTALIYIANQQKVLTEQDFKEFAKKVEAEEGEQLPTNEFVEKKRAEVQEALEKLGEEGGSSTNKTGGNLAGAKDAGQSSTKQARVAESAQNTGGGVLGEAKKEEEAVERPVKQVLTVATKDGQLSAMDMRKVMISLKRIVDLMTCDKQTLSKVIRGFYARIASRRNDKSSKEQYFVDQITGVSWGGEPYKIRGNVLTDIQLHCKKLGQKAVNQLYRTQGENFNDESLALFAEDMKKWKFELPTLASIERKSAEFATAIKRAPKLPRNYRAQGQSAEIAFIGGHRIQNYGGAGQHSAAHTNPAFEQLQHFIQKQVVSQVRTTPGLRPGWAGGSGAPTMVQQRQRQFGESSGGGGNWQRQADAFISGIGTKRPLIAEEERESWRMQQMQQEANRPPPRVDAHILGMFSPPNDYRTPREAEKESLMNIRDFPAIHPANTPPGYQQGRGTFDIRRSYEADQFFGGGAANSSSFPSQASAMQHYNTYMPQGTSKRARLSPQPPPVERFF